ncbi:MAG: GntR family transcriptional regulator [Burkholderiales bacterium]
MPTAAPDAAPTFSPLYRQIKALITSSLEAHEWRPGEMIPSEKELAARFKVSQGTVRKAIDELAAENLLLRRQGKGTFVATHGEARSQFRFLRLAPDEGEPSYPESRIVECRRIRAPAEVARVLDIKPGDSVVYLKRVLYFDKHPCVVDELHLPGGLFRGLTAERLAEGRAPLYGTFETDFGVKMIRADEKIRAVAADGVVAQLLQVPPGTPLLQVDRIAFSYGEKPVEVRRGLYLTRQHHYRNTLN